MPPDEETAYHPELKALPEKNGLFCFLDQARACGADCMAFQRPPEGPDYLAQQWAQCALLTNTHKIGKHSAIVATELVRKNRDDARLHAASGPLPAPNLGGKR